MVLGKLLCVSATGSTAAADTTEDNTQIQRQHAGKKIPNQRMRLKGKSTVMPVGGSRFMSASAK